MKLRPPLWKKGKTYKRPYTGSKRFDSSCRCHGSCGYCYNNRTHFDTKYRTGWKVDLEEFDTESKLEDLWIEDYVLTRLAELRNAENEDYILWADPYYDPYQYEG